MTDTLSRQLARWVAELRYEDLPTDVLDRARGVTLQALASALVSHDMPAAEQALRMMQAEEGGGPGAATVLVSGARLTKAGGFTDERASKSPGAGDSHVGWRVDGAVPTP